MAKTDLEKLAEIDELFGFIVKFQDKIIPQIASTTEIKEGDGRKGILMIRGPNKWARVFEVSDGRLTPCDNVENCRTVIAFDGVDAFVVVIQGFLAGDTSAIARAKARGEVRIEGEYAMRDFMVFNDLFGKVGKVLTDYGVTIGS